MPDPEPINDTAARLQLNAAVDQLTQPVVEQLHRADAIIDSAAAELARDDRAEEKDLTQRHARYLKAGHTAQAVRTLERLIDLRKRIAARVEKQRSTSAVIPALLDQLQAEVASSSSGLGEGAAAVGPHRSVLAIAAVQILQAVEHHTGARRGPHLGEGVRAWAEHAEPAPAAALAEQWVTDIRELINPTKRYQRPGACPDCGHRFAHVHDSSGELVRTTAIEFDPGTKPGTERAHCRRCPAHWVGDTQLRQLGKALEQSRTEPPTCACCAGPTRRSS